MKNSEQQAEIEAQEQYEARHTGETSHIEDWEWQQIEDEDDFDGE